MRKEERDKEEKLRMEGIRKRIGETKEILRMRKIRGEERYIRKK